MPDRFYRDRVHGVVGGVCAGLAEYFGVRTLWVRFVFLLLTLAHVRAGSCCQRKARLRTRSQYR